MFLFLDVTKPKPPAQSISLPEATTIPSTLSTIGATTEAPVAPVLPPVESDPSPVPSMPEQEPEQPRIEIEDRFLQNLDLNNGTLTAINTNDDFLPNWPQQHTRAVQNNYNYS